MTTHPIPPPTWTHGHPGTIDITRETGGIEPSIRYTATVSDIPTPDLPEAGGIRVAVASIAALWIERDPDRAEWNHNAPLVVFGPRNGWPVMQLDPDTAEALGWALLRAVETITGVTIVLPDLNAINADRDRLRDALEQLINTWETTGDMVTAIRNGRAAMANAPRPTASPDLPPGTAMVANFSEYTDQTAEIRDLRRVIAGIRAAATDTKSSEAERLARVLFMAGGAIGSESTGAEPAAPTAPTIIEWSDTAEHASIPGGRVLTGVRRIRLVTTDKQLADGIAGLVAEAAIRYANAPAEPTDAERDTTCPRCYGTGVTIDHQPCDHAVMAAYRKVIEDTAAAERLDPDMMSIARKVADEHAADQEAQAEYDQNPDLQATLHKAMNAPTVKRAAAVDVPNEQLTDDDPDA